MFLALPLNVGKIVNLCERGDSRFSGTIGVHVEVTNEGVWRCVATNGRFLGVLQGFEVDKWTEFAVEPFDTKCQEVVVPPKDWKDIFAGKDGDRVLIVSDGKRIVLHRCQGGLPKRVINCEAIEGRFPSWDRVIPAKPPTAEISVDPELLKDALSVAGAITTDEAIAVDIGFYPQGNGTLVGIKSRGERQTCDCLVVPLAKKEEKPTNGKPHTEEPEDSEEEAEVAEDKDEAPSAS